MALQEIEPLAYPDFRSALIAGADQGLVIDAADEGVACIMQAAFTDSIASIRFRVRVHTTGATLEVRLETVSGGSPSGSLLAVGASGTVTTTGIGDYTCTITTPPSVTRGDFFAVVIKQPAVSAGNCQINTMSVIGNVGMPRTLQYVSSWAFNRSVALAVEVNYTVNGAGTQLTAGVFTDDTALTINTGTTPDERGNVFTIPVTMQVFGCVMRSGQATGNLVLTLYDATGSVLTSLTVPSSSVDTSNTIVHQYRFPDLVTLTAGETYRLTYRSDSGSNVIGFQTSFATASNIDGWVTNGVVLSTFRTDAGAWTDSNLGLVWLGLLINAIDVSSGGSGGGGGRIIGANA